MSNQIYEDQGNPLHIQSSGLLSRAAFHRDLNRHYRRQLTDFPEEVIHSTTTMQRYLMLSPTMPRDNNQYEATAAKFFTTADFPLLFEVRLALTSHSLALLHFNM